MCRVACFVEDGMQCCQKDVLLMHALQDWWLIMRKTINVGVVEMSYWCASRLPVSLLSCLDDGSGLQTAFCIVQHCVAR